jgi:hypothetical protein
VGGAYGTNGRVQKLVGVLKEGDRFEYLGVHKRIAIKLVSKIWFERTCTAFT